MRTGALEKLNTLRREKVSATKIARERKRKMIKANWISAGNGERTIRIKRKRIDVITSLLSFQSYSIIQFIPPTTASMTCTFWNWSWCTPTTMSCRAEEKIFVYIPDGKIFRLPRGWKQKTLSNSLEAQNSVLIWNCFARRIVLIDSHSSTESIYIFIWMRTSRG